MSAWKTFWFVVCWTESGPSFRNGPFEDFEEAERSAREQVLRDGQVIGLMETVPQAVLSGESNARFIAGPKEMPQEDKDRLSRLMKPDSEKVK